MAKGISIPITGNTAPFRKAIKNVEKDLDKFGKTAAQEAKKAATAFTAAAAGVGALATKFYIGYQNAEQANRRVAAINKSMGLFGSTTGMVTKRLTDLGDALERETGFTAESIKETQAKLLTFRQIAKSADEAGGAFDRATKAAIDLSAAGFGEATSNATQLGKALQDPIKGIAALTRVGVTFTAAEKDKIRTLVESNQILDAQDLILSAIETQVGGTAAATVNATTKMKNSVGEVTDILGEGLAPAFDAASDELQKFAEWATKNQAAVSAVAVALTGLVTAIAVVKAAMVIATGVSAAYAAAQAGLAAANLAVQASTIVGIATAAAAAVTIGVLTKQVYDAVKAKEADTKATRENTRATYESADALEAMALIRFRAEKAAEEEEKRRLAAEEAARRAAELTKRRFAALKDTLRQVKQEVRDYVASIREAVTSNVSLSNAVADAEASEQSRTEGITAALENRKQAYEALNQARVTNDVEGYNKALQDVTASEQALATAQAVKAKDYTQIFAEQIAASKSFATDIKTLAPRLSRAALQQILDLGPVAGSKVTKDLIAGTGAITVESLNRDLADIAAAGTAAGMATPGTEALLGTTVGGKATAPTININAGVGDPAEIAKQVVAVLKTYNSRFGKIPIKVG